MVPWPAPPSMPGGIGGALTVNSVNMQALASSQGTGGARAVANGTIREGGRRPRRPIFIPGEVVVDAAGRHGPSGHANASALASPRAVRRRIGRWC